MDATLENLVADQRGFGQTIDIYANGVVEMYSGMGGNPNAPPAWAMNPMQQKPLDQGSAPGIQRPQGFDTPGGFQTTLPQYTQPSLPDIGRPYGDISPINSDVLGNTYPLEQEFSLGERFDFSGHGGSDPHLNYDILKPNGRLGESKILGENHLRNIWDKI